MPIKSLHTFEAVMSGGYG